VLADAIAFAAATLEPSVIVDIATLTGAATLGLGRRHAALYTPSDPLAAALTAAGDAAGERLWRMPLVDDYRESLESAVADVAHVETRKMGGGSITAALFLQRFAGDVPWAHLDIAGPGRADADEHEVVKAARRSAPGRCSTGSRPRIRSTWRLERSVGQPAHLDDGEAEVVEACEQPP
jgi:leucyl aminopeptidase